MKKTIPIYILLLAILAVLVLQLRETKALRAELKAELAGIRNEQFKQPTGKRPTRSESVPVIVVNEPLDVSINR